MEAPIKFTDRDEWRVWLAQNHNKSKGAWLLIGKKNSKNAFLSYEDAAEASTVVVIAEIMKGEEITSKAKTNATIVAVIHLVFFNFFTFYRFIFAETEISVEKRLISLSVATFMSHKCIKDLP